MSTDLVLTITNERGLHARASARFVAVVEEFDATAEVSRAGMKVSGDSIMGLLMLGAGIGTQISVSTHGPQAEALAEALRELVTGQFGEGS